MQDLPYPAKGKLCDSQVVFPFMRKEAVCTDLDALFVIGKIAAAVPS